MWFQRTGFEASWSSEFNFAWRCLHVHTRGEICKQKLGRHNRYRIEFHYEVPSIFSLLLYLFWSIESKIRDIFFALCECFDASFTVSSLKRRLRNTRTRWRRILGIALWPAKSDRLWWKHTIMARYQIPSAHSSRDVLELKSLAFNLANSNF